MGEIFRQSLKEIVCANNNVFLLKAKSREVGAHCLSVGLFAGTKDHKVSG